MNSPVNTPFKACPKCGTLVEQSIEILKYHAKMCPEWSKE